MNTDTAAIITRMDALGEAQGWRAIPRAVWAEAAAAHIAYRQGHDDEAQTLARDVVRELEARP